MAKQTVLAQLVTQLSADSTGFQKEVQKAVAKNVQYRQSAKAANDANTKLSNGFRKAANSTAILTGPLNGVSGRLSFLASGIASSGVAFTMLGVSIAGLSVIMKSAVSVAADYERSFLKTEALIRSTGGAAGFTADQLRQQASAVALATLQSVQGVEQAQQVLLTFKNISGTVFNDTIAIAGDMAAVMGTDIKNSALQLGKALEDPKNGLTALRRAGVSFTDSERAMIISMFDTGRAAQGQALILQKLKEQVGGAGAAEAGGLAGAVDTLSQRWDELMLSLNEATGTGAGVTKFINRVARGMNKVSESINGTTDRTKRLNELFKEHGEVLEKIERNQNNEVYKDKLNARRKAILEEVDLLNQQTIAEGEAHKQGALQQKNIEEGKQADRIKKANEASSALLTVLDAQLGSEAEKVQISYEKRIEDLQTLQLSEQEITKRGYESLEELRRDYASRALGSRDEALQRIRDRANQEFAIEQEKQNRLRQLEQDELRRTQQLEQAKKMASVGAMLGNLQSLGQHSKKMAGIAKAAAISQAIINTYAAANQALAAPFPWPIPQVFAGVAIASGLANVAAIKAQQPPSFIGGGYIPDGPRIGGVDGKGGIRAIVHPDESIIDHKKGQGVAKNQNIAVNITMPGDPGADFMDNFARNEKRIVRTLKTALNRPY